MLKPDYQRNYIQSNSEASKFVESVYYGYMIPMVILSKNKTGVLEVVDGQQRLTSLLRYMNNEYKLVSLKCLPSLNNFYYDELPQDLKSVIDDYEINATVILSKNDANCKYLMFERLNKGSKALSEEELRRSKYRNNLLYLAEELCNIDIVSNLFTEMGISSLRFEDSEFILRLISISEDYPDIKYTANSQINTYLEKSEKFTDDKLNDMKEKFLSVIGLFSEYIPISTIARSNNRIAKTDFEPIFINFYKYFTIDTIVKNITNIKYALNYLINFDEDYLSTMTKGTDSRQLIMSKVNIVYNSLKAVIGV